MKKIFNPLVPPFDSVPDNLTDIDTRPYSALTGYGTGISTWLGAPSSANLLAAVTDETGTGSLVFGTAPTFTTSIITPIVYGSTSASGNLTLAANNQTQPNAGLIYVDNHINIDNGTRTFTTTPDASVNLNGTYTVAYGGSKGGNFRDSSTLIFQGTSTTFAASLFNTVTVVTNDSTMVVGLATFVGFIGAQTIQADSQDITQTEQRSFVEEGVFTTTGTGTPIMRNTLWSRFKTSAPILTNVRAGAIVKTAIGVNLVQPTSTSTGFIHSSNAINIASHTTGRDFNRAIKAGTGIWELSDDIYQMDENKGLTMIDRTTNIRRRLYVNSGTLTTEAIEFYLPDELTTGLFAYYRADQANVAGVADGADVTIWHDKSGNGRDLAQGGGTDVPIWENAVTYANNQPAINFTSANSQSLENTRDASIVMGFTGPFTWWGVVSFKTVAAAMRVFAHNTTSPRGVGITATPNWTLRMGSGAATSAGTPAIDTVYLMRVYCTTTTQALYINEVSVTTGAAAQNMGQSVWGAHRTTAPVYSEFMNGYIYEGGIYSAGDISAWAYWENYKSYLETRYSIVLP